MGRTLKLLDGSAYLLLRVAVLSVRIMWLFTFGWLLGGFYAATAVLLSPFWTVFGGAGSNVVETTLNIALLTPGKDR